MAAPSPFLPTMHREQAACQVAWGCMGGWTGVGLPPSLPTFGAQGLQGAWPGWCSPLPTPTRTPAHHETNLICIRPWGWGTFSGQ